MSRASSNQMKSAALPPLVDVEREPGETLKRLIEVPHPFAFPAPLDEDSVEILRRVVQDPEHLNHDRKQAIRYWLRRAKTLANDSIKLIKDHPDPHIRRLS